MSVNFPSNLKILASYLYLLIINKYKPLHYSALLTATCP